MRLDCPHCGSQLRVEPTESDVEELNVVDRRLHGDEYVCRECQNELGVYHY